MYYRDPEEAEVVARQMRDSIGCKRSAIEVAMLAPWQPEPEVRAPVACKLSQENVTKIDLTTGIVRAVAVALSDMDEDDEPPRWMYKLSDALDVPVDWLTSEAKRSLMG
jgi:hypothetical protein